MSDLPQPFLIDEILRPVHLELVKVVADRASKLGMQAFLVGGFVRDLIMGGYGKDLDIVIVGDAIRLARSLEKDYGGTGTYHAKFKTARLDISEWAMVKQRNWADQPYLPPSVLDLITARSETYDQPASLPTVKTGTILDDLSRRDFTINTLAIRLNGEERGKLLDPLGGRGNITKGIIRVLHQRSFIDDPTRMYRAVRYEQRFGFKIAPETSILISAGRAYINNLTAERIRTELDLILNEPKAPFILARLNELNLLQPIHTGLPWDESVATRLAQMPVKSLLEDQVYSISRVGWTLWLLSASDEEIDRLNVRLQFDAGLFKSLHAASRLWKEIGALNGLKPSQWVEILDKMPLLSVFAVSLSAPEADKRQVLQRYLEEWRYIKPKTTGETLKRLGLEPGEKYHFILHRLRSAWLDGEVASAEQELNLLEKLIK